MSLLDSWVLTSYGNHKNHFTHQTEAKVLVWCVKCWFLAKKTENRRLKTVAGRREREIGARKENNGFQNDGLKCSFQEMSPNLAKSSLPVKSIGSESLWEVVCCCGGLTH
ncbi:hypothetical protein AVEN_194530-1 [Araneus ventricosus]|uniref:Uncharacterized protein n=1 Tax=Araneus ventricosus TaxID=182803 RepID=A0A4Y2A6F7_ARAVE|nr:hypothetical protein AVEN_194530-1 [Araneus ventricosus]